MEKYILYIQKKQDQELTVAQIMNFSSVTVISDFLWSQWTEALQSSLSITNSQSLLKLMSIELVTPSNHLILCRPLLSCLQSSHH